MLLQEHLVNQKGLVWLIEANSVHLDSIIKDSLNSDALFELLSISHIIDLLKKSYWYIFIYLSILYDKKSN